MPAHRILLAVVGLGLAGMLPILVAAQTQPSTDSGKAALSAEQVFSRVSPAVVRVVVRDRDFKEIGLGSGFFVAADGLLVTNHHVVRGAQFATVLRADGSTLFVDGVLALDEGRDLAILKVNGTGLPCLEVVPADAPPPVGTQVYAVGNPLGQTNTFSNGMISGIRKEGGEVREIQTNAAISPGSSGGPLVDAQGRVVGVIKSYMVDGQALNFAVPAAAVRALHVKAATAKPAPLASAGGKSLDAKATRELDAAYAAIAEKRWSDAVGILTGLRSRQPDNPFVWLALGHLHSQLGNHELEIDAYKTAIRLKPDYAHAHLYLGMAYIKTAIRLNPDDAAANVSRMHLFAEAVEPLKTAIRLKPDDNAAYFSLSIAYSEMGRYAEEIEVHKSIIRLKPDDADAYLFLGKAYVNMGHGAEAVEAYKTAIRLKPDYADAYLYLGMAYSEMGRYAEAVEALKTAIRLKPDDAHAYLHLGLAYSRMGNRVEALRAYQALQRLNPTKAEILRFSIERMPESTKQNPNRLPDTIPRQSPR